MFDRVLSAGGLNGASGYALVLLCHAGTRARAHCELQQETQNNERHDAAQEIHSLY